MAAKKASKKTAKKKKKSTTNGRKLHQEIAKINLELMGIRRRDQELDKKRMQLIQSLPRISVGGYNMRFEIDKKGNPEISVGCVHISEQRLHRDVLPFVAANFGYEIKKIPEKELLKEEKKTKKKK